MRTHLVAFAATLSIAGLAAASPSLASGTVTSGGGSSGGGGASAGGGGMHGGGGGGGGEHGGGGYAGGHAGGGHYGGAHFGGGGYRGGGYGGHAGFAAHASYTVHGGYIAHGPSGYHIVGYESAGLARGGEAPRGGHGAPTATLALGPRTGSAATAMRVDHLARADEVHARSTHPWHPGHPHQPHRPHVRIAQSTELYGYEAHTPLFCDYTFLPHGQSPQWGCLMPIKAKAASAR